jgi:hypothetical protein
MATARKSEAIFSSILVIKISTVKEYSLFILKECRRSGGKAPGVNNRRGELSLALSRQYIPTMYIRLSDLQKEHRRGRGEKITPLLET